MDFLKQLFGSGDFQPQGFCYLWNSRLDWLHAIPDLLIALAYFHIPLTLLWFVRKRRDLPFSWIFMCFGIFIVACGATHVMEIWNLWHANYWLAGALKAVTAAASIVTAILLVRLAPGAVGLPRLGQWFIANSALALLSAHTSSPPRSLRNPSKPPRTQISSVVVSKLFLSPKITPACEGWPSKPLPNLGYKVVVTSDGEQALHEFQAQRDQIDLLHLDLVLPRVSGPHVYSRICELKLAAPVTSPPARARTSLLCKRLSSKVFPSCKSLIHLGALREKSTTRWISSAPAAKRTLPIFKASRRPSRLALTLFLRSWYLRINLWTPALCRVAGS